MNFNRLAVMTGLAALAAAPVYATPYCLAVGGGFGHGGTSFVARNFTLPTANTCNPWTGYTKTASSVVLITSGTACLSSDSKVLTVSVFSADPAFLGSGNQALDYIQLCPVGVKSCPLGGGSDSGSFSGVAEPQSCTNTLLTLPALHD
jgi:hypothetical protein